MTAPSMSSNPTPISTPPGSAEWRSPDGRTAEEVLADLNQTKGRAQQLEESNRELFGIAQQFNQQTRVQPQAPAPIGNEDYVQGGQLNAWGQQMYQTQMAPQINAAVDMAASNSLAITKQLPSNAPIFQKYGNEVEAMLREVPKNLHTVDNIQRIVSIVRGNHFDDLAREYASQEQVKWESAVRSNGGVIATPVSPEQQKYTLQSETLPPDWKARAAAAGLTESALDEFCKANNMTRKDFFDQFPRELVVGIETKGRTP